ncbi:hypothetical protein HETIRDRAFT_318762 [Heterobasidion irregulare TC 32-1]|uniref:Uncharacterized protein n=1 Tax=Heterobasidion irregulare (strain TC 32-1) TaxID=747525 RepID=W4K7H0_HETIT|nr:uncharacterized protein HETIRDRAFT_318762 [Heterobasidion irregulare TC 32-1]ETW81748.1 hypothetical protein HETIRDRAFT_318762 [Heterobasidion irregulare TC 32-1]
MATPTRFLSTGRHASSLVWARSFSTSRALREGSTANLGAPPVQKKPVGGIRGGVIGFLFGFSLASSFAAYRLLDEYKQASAALQASVEELQRSTEQALSSKISAHVKRIEAVEKDLKALSGSSASKDDVSRVRGEMKKIYDGLHIEFLDLRAFVWGMQQDVHALAKKESTSVRV